jgi:hypothetical protein
MDSMSLAFPSEEKREAHKELPQIHQEEHRRMINNQSEMPPI